jgi:hypothetical protein
MDGWRQVASRVCLWGWRVHGTQPGIFVGLLSVLVLPTSTTKMSASMSASTSRMSEFTKGRTRAPGPAHVFELLGAVLESSSGACPLWPMLSEYKAMRKQLLSSSAMLSCRSIALAVWEKMAAEHVRQDPKHVRKCVHVKPQNPYFRTLSMFFSPINIIFGPNGRQNVLEIKPAHSFMLHTAVFSYGCS